MNSDCMSFKAAKKGYKKALSETKKASCSGIEKEGHMSRLHRILAKGLENGLTCVRTARGPFRESKEEKLE